MPTDYPVRRGRAAVSALGHRVLLVIMAVIFARSNLGVRGLINWGFRFWCFGLGV